MTSFSFVFSKRIAQAEYQRKMAAHEGMNFVFSNVKVRRKGHLTQNNKFSKDNFFNFFSWISASNNSTPHRLNKMGNITRKLTLTAF